MSARDRTAQAQADLAWLERHGASEGVAAIIAERRKQIEVLGYTRRHDDLHKDGLLGREAGMRAIMAHYMVTHDPYGNKDSADEFAEAGAMAAAEIDRLEALP
jgi:hypothetical protein